MKFLQNVTPDVDLNRVQNNVAEAFRSLEDQIATQISTANTVIYNSVVNTISNTINNTTGPGIWGDTVPLRGTTTDGVTWVNLMTISMPLNSSVLMVASFLGTEPPPMTPLPGQPATYGGSQYGHFSRGNGPGAIAAGTGTIWASGTAGNARIVVTGLNITIDVLGTAGFTMNWLGAVSKRWNP